MEKGTYNNLCARSACNNSNSLYFNYSTEKYYCKECAERINKLCRVDAIQVYGHDICLEEVGESHSLILITT